MNATHSNLDQLHDVIAPPATPWWPPAPGWLALFGFLALIFLVLAIRWFLRWQQRRYRREAIAELALYEPALSVPEKRAAAIAAITCLLKRAAVTAWPRPEVASLTGPAWLEFLDHTANTDQFHTPTGGLLEAVTYDPPKADGIDDETLRKLPEMVHHWLLHHRTATDERSSA